MQIKPLSFNVTSVLKPQTKISVMECTEKASPVQIELSGSEVGRAMYAGMGINFKGSLEPIDVTESGRVTDANFVFLNALLPIVLRFEGSVTDESDVQPSNAERPMLVTEFAIVTVVTFAKFLKTLLPILVTPFLTSIFVACL